MSKNYTILVLTFLLFFARNIFGQTTYTLVTSTAGLVAGDKYIIASAQSGSAQLLGYQNTNNRPQSTAGAYTITSSTITTTPATATGETNKPYEFTLGGSTGAWTLYDGVYAGYLYAASSSSNYLRTAAGVANWTITFSSNAAIMTCTTGSFTNNILRYNSTSSLFSCYSSGQAAVYLFKVSAATNYYWNGNNTSPLNSTWNTTNTNWSSPTSSASVTAAWPSSGTTNVANFNSATSSCTVTIPGTLAAVPQNINIGTSNYTFATTGSTAGATSSNINLNSNTLTFAPISTAALNLSGIISGTIGALTQNGAGTTTLSGANTYTGATTVNSGTLSISSIANGGSASNIGQSTNSAGNLVLGGGTLQYTGSSASTDRSFTLTAATTSTIDVTNALTITGAGANTSGALTKAGAGTLTLSGTNAYTGATTINAGTLQLGVNSALSSSTAVTLANTTGAIFDVNGKTQTIASLSGGGGTGGNVTLGAGTLTVNGSSSTSYSGIMSGTNGNLVKSGASTLTLGGANTYTGTTTVNNGTLSISSIANGGSASNIGQSTNAAGNLVLGGGTLQYTGSTASTNRSFTLTAATTSTIDVTNTLTISGSNTTTSGALTKSGAGTLILTGAYTHTGTNTFSAGELRLNPSGNLSLGAGTFTGGKLATTGIAATRTLTFSSLNVSNASSLALETTNGHRVTFTNAGTITSGLTITGWQGTYGVDFYGSVGRIFVGSDNTSLTCSQLSQIQFFDGTTTYASALNTEGELVPVKTPTITGITPSSATAGDPGFTITVDGTNFIDGISTVTWGGSARATTFVSATQLTATILTSDLVTATTVQVGVSNGCVASPSTQTFTINAPSNSITTSAGSFGPFCNGISNDVTLSFSKTGSFSGQYNIQISDALQNFPSDATSQLLTYVSSTSNSVTATIPSSFTAGTIYRIRVVNNTPTYFSSGDNGSNITINTTPTTPSCSTPAAVCQGNAVTITGAGSTGATTYTYWTASSGGTQYTTGSPAGYTVSGGNLTTPSNLSAGTYDFYVQAENAALCSSLARQKVTVTINGLPSDPGGSISISPSNPSCGPATLSYSSGYYWETSTSDFTTSGRATSSNYTLNSTGTMYVRAYDGTCWSANTINTGSVTINTAVAIGTDPSDQTVTTGATASFSVSGVTGTVNGYQWQVSTDNGSTWNNVSTGTGGTSASYTTATTVIGMNGYKYKCIVYGTSPCSDVTSGIATLTVNVAPSGLGNYPFTGTTCTNYAPTGVATNLTLSNISPTGITCNTNVASNIFGGSSSWGTAFSSGKYLEFTATPDANFLLTATSVVFDAWRSSAGAQNYTLRSSLDSYGSDIATGSVTTTQTTITVNLSSSFQNLSSAVTFRIYGWGGNSSGDYRLDNITLNGYLTPSCTPPAAASGISTSNPTIDGFNIGWTAGAGNGTMIVIRATSSGNTLPSSGSSYTPNLAWGSAAQIDANNRVVFRNSGTSAGPVTGLLAETQYTVTAYEYSTTGNCYNLSSPPSTTRYTLSTEPSVQPTGSFTATTCTDNSIDLTFPSISGAGVSNADGYIIMMNAGSAPSNTPTDGQSYSVNASISGDTVAAVINSTATSSITISGLNAGVQYYFTLIPYNANSTPTAQTFNYKTNGTILGANTTTLSTGTSTASVVTTDASYGYTQDILYANYQSDPVPLSSGQSVGVHNIIIQDGNGSSNDGDNLPTLLKGITFTYTGTANTIRSAALFTTTNSRIRPATSIGANTITFTNLPDTVTLKTPGDNSSIQLILRVTFNSTVTDNDKLIFTVSSVTSGDLCSYSQFGSANGGGAQSDNGANTKNKIEVVATKLKFSQQPSDAANGATMTPDVKLDAADNNNNVDKDWNVAASVSCSTPSALNSNPVGGTISQGVTTIGALVHNTNGTYTLTASAAGLRDTTSTAYTISTILSAYGSFLSVTGSGNYTSNSSWCKCTNLGGCTGYTVNSGGWGDPATNSQTPIAGASGSTVYIQGIITFSSGTAGAKNATILSGGDLILYKDYPLTDLTVKTGGSLHVNYGSILTPAGTFTVEDSANVYLNSAFSGPSSSIWAGTENFYPKSNLYINNWRTGGTPQYLVDGNVTSNTHNGYKAMFGNLYIDDSQITPAGGAEVTSYNNNGFGGGNWDMLGPNNGDTINLTHGNLEFVRTPLNVSGDCSCGNPGTTQYRNPRIMGNETGTFVVNVHGDLKLKSTWAGTAVSSTDGNYTLNVDGNVDIAGGSFNVKNSTSTTNGINTLNINGNLTMSGTTSLYLNFGSLNTANGQKAVLNLKGNLTVASTATIQNNVFPTDAEFNFTGTSPQLVDVASVLAPSGKGITFTIKNGATVQLKNNNFTYTTAISSYPTTLTVASGGTLDFNWKTDGTPLVVSGASTINTFTAAQGSTLKITSPQGIVKNTATYGSSNGNVIGFATGNRDYNQVARYWYTGKSNSTHYTGDGINQTGVASGFGKVVICDLLDNNKILTPTVKFALSNDSTTFSGGGRLDIRKGQFIETEDEYISGTDGTLYMSPGTLYKIPRGNSSFVTNDDIPRMCGCGNGSFPYVLTGGTIELSGTGSNHAYQRLRSDNASYNYINVKYSGSNTLGSDYKNLSQQTEIDSNLIITGSAVVDCFTGGTGSAASFVGRGGLTMDGGRLRIKKFNEANPMLSGFNNPYNLTGGVVEFYGTGNINQQQIRGKDTLDRIISYYNMEINADAANYSTSSGLDKAGNVDLSSSFYLKNIMNVNYPAVLRMDKDDFIYAPLTGAGAEVVNINANAGLLYGNSNGITTAASGTGVTVGNIRTTNRTYSNTASYGFIGSGNMVSGNGLPATIKSLYVYKTNTTDKVTLTNTVRADSLLKMYSGHILTGASNLIELGMGINTGETGTLNYSAGYVAGKMRRWFNGANTGNASGLFPMGDTSSNTFYNRHFLMEFSTLTGTDAGYLDINFNRSPMGLAGIPIIGIPAAGSCTNPFDVTSTEDQGYWVATPESSKLSPGTYTASATGEGFSSINNMCQLTLLKRVGGGNWTTPGTHLQPTGTMALPTVSRSGISGFSNFGFGGGPPNPLPIELTSFTGTCSEDGTAQLQWTTASENNSKKFIVQRSADGVHFDNIAVTRAAGFSNQPRSYSITDSSIISNANYYRLLELDNEGNSTIYSIILVKCREVNGVHVFYHEPKIVLEVNSDKDKSVAVHVFEISGKMLHQETKSVTRGYNRFNLDIKNKLADGLYIIQLTDGLNMFSDKVLVH